jgi:hypothetical protein
MMFKLDLNDIGIQAIVQGDLTEVKSGTYQSKGLHLTLNC